MVAKTQEPPSWWVYSVKNLPTMYENHLDDIKRMYVSPAIGTLGSSEFSKIVKALLIRIHVITGWMIPENELLNVFVDQVRKKMIESYYMLNTEEIEYAFRNTGSDIKDWGKHMNIFLLDQVLSPYIEKKKQVELIAKREYEREIDRRLEKNTWDQDNLDLLPITKKRWWSTSSVLNRLSGIKQVKHYL